MLVAEAFAFLEAPVERVTMPDIPFPANRRLVEHALPGVESIAAAMRSACHYRPGGGAPGTTRLPHRFVLDGA